MSLRIAMQSTVSTTMRNLTIVHRSDNFLVVDKPPDLIINSDDPDRDSVYLRLQRQFPDLADISKYKVSRWSKPHNQRLENPKSKLTQPRCQMK